MITLLLRFRTVLAPAVAGLVLVLAAYAAFRVENLDWLLGGAVAAAALYVAIKSYLELLELITDMLMPR